MKIIKPQTLGLLYKTYSFLGKHYLVISAIGFFQLGKDNQRFLTENTQWSKLLPYLPQGHVLDEVMPKQYAEALVLGSAHSPSQKPIANMEVSFCIANVRKTLCVTGHSEWRRQFLSKRMIGKPKRFTTMPLRSSQENDKTKTSSWFKQQGVFPTLSNPASIKSSECSVVGFGPVDMASPQRKQYWGTYKKRWLKDEAPGFASDIDWRVFNMAPEDQWNDKFFQGGDSYCLVNLHPTKPIIQGALPKLNARAFIRTHEQPSAALTEVPMQLDTIWFVPEQELGVSIFHGQTEISDSDGLDVALMMLAYDGYERPKSLEHYKEVVTLRTHKESATQHVFNESQLAAEHSAEALARKANIQRQTEEAALAKSQKRLDLLDAQYWAKLGKKPPVGYEPPKASLPALGLLPAEIIREGDFDLTDVITKAKALIDDVKAKSKKALSSVNPVPNVILSEQEQFESALARAIVPAVDLLPLPCSIVDPGIGPQLKSLEKNYLNGQFADEESYQKARVSLLKVPALKRQARRSAPSVLISHLPLLPMVAVQLGAQIREWHSQGICLAGRDLSGANLMGMNFSGADLREVMLEGANLTGASFRGADLQGAIFVGAEITETDFSEANLRQANLSCSRGVRAKFTGANLSHTQVLDAYWVDASFENANLERMLAIRLTLDRSTLDDVYANKATFADVKAEDTQWKSACLGKTVFLKTDLRGSNFSKASLFKTVLNNAQLQGSQWQLATLESVQGGGSADWSYADFKGMIAKKCGFRGARFTSSEWRLAKTLRCDFGLCDFSYANMDDALFSYPQFYKATFNNLSAKNTELFQAVCRKADFTQADVSLTRFYQSEMTGALGVFQSEVRV